ncbi:MAG: hypothetical protein ABIQ30_16415 [Devosia sp.]
MNPVTDLTAAWQGWAEIVAGHADAGRHFKATASGLLAALLWFVLALLLSTAVQSIPVGMPSTGQVLMGFVVQAATLAVLAVAMAQTLRFLKLPTPLLALLVPTIYALALMFVVAIPLTLLGPNVGLIAMLALAGMIFQAARIVGGMKAGVAIAFAFLCLMVLVVVPNALYMLFLQSPSPA